MSTIRIALRALRRRPTFALIAIGLLATGIGAVSAIFSLIDVAILRDLPFVDPNRLMVIKSVEPNRASSTAFFGLAAEQLVRLRREVKLFSAVEGALPKNLAMVGTGDPLALRGMQVSSGMFAMLGTTPRLGRSFSRDEEITASPVAIVSDAFWRDRLHADPNALQQTINIDGVPRKIIGVMPAGFSIFFDQTDVYLPLPLDAAAQTTRFRATIGIARLSANATPAQALAELSRIYGTIGDEIPQFKQTRPQIISMRDELFGDTQVALLVIAGAVAILMIIACVNVLNLSFSDALSRRQSTMVRLAFGASRTNVAMVRAGEAVVLTTIASVIGLLLGRLALVALASVDPRYFAGFGDLSLSVRTVAVTLLAGLIAGSVSVLPVEISESRLSISSIAGTATRAVGERRDQLIREFLLAGQVTLALILLFGATLLGRNLLALSKTPQGFDPENLYAFRLSVPAHYQSQAERGAYVKRLIDAVSAVPGVTSATATQSLFSLGSSSLSFFAIAGVATPDSTGLAANIRHVMPGAFEVTKTKLVEGRLFDATDRPNTHPVAVVSASFAKVILNGRAIGARLRRTARSEYPWTDVVGVVEDVKDAGLGVDLGPTVWIDYEQENQPTVSLALLARVRDSRLHIERAVQQAIWSVDRSQPLSRIATVETLERESAAEPRFQASVVGLFGAAALILVVGGIYAVTLFSVLKRTREIGVRSALGASAGTLIAESAWRGVRPLVIGCVVGLLAAIPLVRLMQRSLNQSLSAQDTPMLAGAMIILVLAALVAAVLPALRATRISPVVAMRS